MRIPAHCKLPNPELTAADPRIAPTKACARDDGMPVYHVISAQTVAPHTAAKKTGSVAASGSTSPRPTVRAIAEPNRNGPVSMAAAVSSSAGRAASAREAISVASNFALS